MAKKKKKSKFKKYLILTCGGLAFGLFMLMGASSATVSTEGGRQVSVASAQTSNLETYLNTRTEEQIALVEAAQSELTTRGGADTKGGDSYIETLNPTLLNQNVSRTHNITPLNIQWDSYFIGQVMTNAGIDISDWNAGASTFATKLHQNGKFNIAEGYIPREGDIIFWGKKLRSLSDGQTIKARHCGIVTKVEIIADHTLIKAMRITVIEGDVEGEIINGSYDHSTAYIETYTYDLYESTNTRYGQIMGYGTAVSDIPESDEIIYTIDLKSTFDEAQGGSSQ